MSKLQEQIVAKETFLEICWKQPNSCKNMRALETAYRYLISSGARVPTMSQVLKLSTVINTFAQQENTS